MDRGSRPVREHGSVASRFGDGMNECKVALPAIEALPHCRAQVGSAGDTRLVPALCCASILTSDVAKITRVDEVGDWSIHESSVARDMVRRRRFARSGDTWGQRDAVENERADAVCAASAPRWDVSARARTRTRPDGAHTGRGRDARRRRRAGPEGPTLVMELCAIPVWKRVRGDHADTPQDYLMTFVTVPAPTVRPPSRIAKRRPSSMAIGWIRVTVISVVSPGITISVPSGKAMTPVTSVVRK